MLRKWHDLFGGTPDAWLDSNGAGIHVHHDGGLCVGLSDVEEGLWLSCSPTPEQAREIAARLLLHADEVEGETPCEHRWLFSEGHPTYCALCGVNEVEGKTEQSACVLCDARVKGEDSPTNANFCATCWQSETGADGT